MGWRVHRFLLGHKVIRHERIDQSTYYGLVRDTTVAPPSAVCEIETA